MNIRIRTIKERQLEDFLSSYWECAFWSSTDDKDEPLDANYSMDDVSKQALSNAILDCEKFLDENDLLDFDSLEDYNATDAGHDFWLTRNHHGAGFWDRTQLREDTLGDLVTAYVHDNFKEINLIVGDDGKLYLE